MIKENFYTNSETTIQLDTPSGTDEVVYSDGISFNHSGDLSPYWIGYIEASDVPDFFIPREFAIIEDSSLMDIKKKELTANADFAYVQKSAVSLRGFNFNYSRNQSPVNNADYCGYNKISVLNAPRFSSPMIRVQFSFAYKYASNVSWKDVTGFAIFTTFSDFIDFIAGTGSVTVTFTGIQDANEGSQITSNYSLTFTGEEVDGKYIQDSATIGINSCDYIVGISGFDFNRTNTWYKKDGFTPAINSAGSTCGMDSVIKVSTENDDFLYSNYGSMVLQLPYSSSNNHLKLITLTVANVGGTNYYKNTGLYFMSPISNADRVDFEELWLDPSQYMNLDNGLVFDVNHQASGSGFFHIIPRIYLKDLRFAFARFPMLSHGDVNDLFLPEFDGNRLTGNFFPLSELPQKGTDWQKDNDPTKDEYKESDKPKPSGENISDDPTKITGDSYPTNKNFTTNIGSAMCSLYDMSGANVTELITLLSNVASSFWEAIGTATDYKESNILDYIVSLRFYPFQVYNEIDIPTANIKFGFNNNSVVVLQNSNTFKLHRSTVHHSHGSITTQPKNGTEKTFLDFEPYTVCKVFLPYLGLVQIPSIDVIGCTIELNSFTDLVTGMCTYYIDSTRDSVTRNVYVGTCKIGCDISVSGNNVVAQAEKTASAYMQTINDVVVGGANIPKKLIEGRKFGMDIMGKPELGEISGIGASVVGIVDSVVNDAIGLATARRAVPERVSSGSESGNLAYNNVARLIVERPAVRIPATYGHEFGYPYNQSDVLRKFKGTGFVACSNPDVSGIACTESERSMIYSYLTSGVIL
jgi:hypothetical protein